MFHAKRYFWVPILLFFLMLLDGVFASVFSVWLIEPGYILVPRLTVIGLVLISFLVNMPSLWWVSIIIGLMYDSYFSGILGIYLCIFPCIVSIIRRFKNNIRINAFTMGLSIIVFITFVEVAVFIFYMFLGKAHMDWQTFLVRRLNPTLVLNIVLYYISYIPLKSLASWISEEPRRSRHSLLRK